MKKTREDNQKANKIGQNVNQTPAHRQQHDKIWA
jgi:hypothetical protein